MKGWLKGGLIGAGIGAMTGIPGADVAFGATGAGAGAAADKVRENNKGKQVGGIQGPQGQFSPQTTAGPLKADMADQYAPTRFQNKAPGSGGPTQTPQGFDYSSPGVAEQYWNQQQNRTTGDTNAAQYWNQVAGQFNQPTRSEGVADAGTSAYFARAAQKAMENMQAQQAAAGTLGSSVGGESINDAIMGLRAREAMDNANFSLQAAGQADQAHLSQLGLGGQMSGAVDQGQMNQFNSGMNAAMAAQDARRTRGQDMYSNVLTPASMLSGMAGNAYGDMLGQDQALMDAAMAAELGLGREALNQSYMKADRQKEDELHSATMAKNIYGFGGMGGGG